MRKRQFKKNVKKMISSGMGDACRAAAKTFREMAASISRMGENIQVKK